MAINKELIHKMQERILDHPESYLQRVWFGGRVGKEAAEACQTVGCLAGHACLAAGGYAVTNGVVNYEGTQMPAAMLATELLGISKTVRDSLFGASSADWPEPYRSQWAKAERANDKQGMACAAVGVLENLIETDGWTKPAKEGGY